MTPEQFGEMRADIKNIKEMLEAHVGASCKENGCDLNDRVVKLEGYAGILGWVIAVIGSGGGLFWLIDKFRS